MSDEQPKKRRGKATKSKKGESAEFQPGGAAAPVFDPAKIADELNIWWEAEGGDSFWVGDVNGWAKWPKEALLDLCMSAAYVARKRREGEFLPESARLLVYLRTNRRVDGTMWGLAGYPAGLHRMPSGERLIVRNASPLIEPKAGDWSLVKELIEGRLDLSRDEIAPADNDGASDEEIEAARAARRTRNLVNDQVMYWHAFHKTVLQSQLDGTPGNWTQRPLLVLAGPGGTGKSRLQRMVTNGLLGGSFADPKKWLTGVENFNLNMVKAVHLMMGELDNVSQKMVDRLAFSEAIKAILANEGVTARLMRTDPVTITPFWVVTLSMNNDPDKMRSFPPLTPDFRDKVIMLLVRRQPLPMPTRTVAEKKAFNDAVAAQLPAYAHWLLNEFEIPAELLVDEHGIDATRFGCRSWQHPSLADDLFEDSPAAEMLALIDAAVFGSALANTKLWDLKSDHKTMGDAWRGSAIELERLLMGDVNDFPSSVAREAKRLFTHSKCDRLLGRLAEDKPDRVVQARTGTKRGWMVLGV